MSILTTHTLPFNLSLNFEAKVDFPDPEPPVFSIEQAKELATEPERRFGRIKEIVSKIVNLFSPLINKFKSDKTQDSKEDNESR